ncbi:MAG: dipeptidase [Deltaproteobacteria bacterium]|nr:dipeptidase [Deltaproteobacteria bacterium]
MRSRNYFLMLVGIVLFTGCTQAEPDYYAEALKIHHEVLTIDTHIDTPMLLLNKGWNIAEEHSLNGNVISRVDLPRMKKGGLDAAFFAVFVGQRERTEENYRSGQEEAEEMIGAVKGMCKSNPSVIRFAITPEQAYSNRQENLLTAFMGLENGFPVARDITNIKKYYDMGIRYMTLCHTKNNDICDSANDTPEHNGLSEFGRKVIKRMNELGMIIDVSHISDKSFYDVIELSSAPVVASHSSARAICDNPRNMTDEMLLKLKENGGVIQMCILSAYVKTPPENPKRDEDYAALEKKYGKWNEINDKTMSDKYLTEWMAIEAKYPGDLATVKDFVDHIDHVVNLIGIDYVGIGTDFDGGGGLRDCRDTSELPNITAELLQRGYSKDDLRKIWGGNFMRVFKRVIKLAEKNI